LPDGDAELDHEDFSGFGSRLEYLLNRLDSGLRAHPHREKVVRCLNAIPCHRAALGRPVDGALNDGAEDAASISDGDRYMLIRSARPSFATRSPWSCQGNEKLNRINKASDKIKQSLSDRIPHGRQR
jgi:hypothetical protein